MTDYKLPFLELISNKIKKKIKFFSDWIDYWSIDFDSQNKYFKNMWFSYRTPKIRKLTLKTDSYYYKDAGDYVILVKVIDILGIESIKSFVIKII